MTFTYIADVLQRFRDYPLERVRLHPIPGTATEQDVLDVERTEGKLCELIDGTLVEKAMGFRESAIGARLIVRIGNFVEPNDLGVVAGADGTVKLFPGQVRIPDVAFFSTAKLPNGELPAEPIPELVPDLAVEVLSKTNSRGEMLAKLKDYFFAGVRLVWYVDPEAKAVEVYTTPDRVTRLTEADALTGGDVLPGFALPVAQLFARGEGG
jgi:Uma2 family endonuclease